MTPFPWLLLAAGGLWGATSSLVAASAVGSPTPDRYPPVRPVRATPAPAQSEFTVHPDQPQQVIAGLGFEIQSDSIASANAGLPDSTRSVPHDLTVEERQRLASEMLSGFRYCRLAGGLYWRGLDAAQQTLQPRWPAQLEELRTLIEAAGIEGVSLEYWSPPPYWKANRKYSGDDGSPNVLRCYGPNFAQDADYHGDVARFLSDFATACRRDLETLRAHGIPVAIWGLQNEPMANTAYSTCVYRPADYARTFLAVAPMVRAYDPKIMIIADTGPSWTFPYIRPVLQDPATAQLVDALVIHHIGSDAKIVHPPFEPSHKPRFQNEYEYQPWQGPATPDKCLNTVEHIMNWFQLGRAPSWFWIHALKPFTNQEASGYSLGFWRPADDAAVASDSRYPPGLKAGHWIFNPYNWNAVGSFVRQMPWDVRGVTIDEQKPDDDLRVFAFLRPNAKLTVVVANRCGAAHRFLVHTGVAGAAFKSFRYSPDEAGPECRGVPGGIQTGATISTSLPDLSWEFWEQL